MSLHGIPNGGPADRDSDDVSDGGVGEPTPSAIGRSHGSDDHSAQQRDARDTGESTGDGRTGDDAPVSVQALELREKRSAERSRERSVTTPSEGIHPKPLPDRDGASTDTDTGGVDMPSRMGWRRSERPSGRTGDAVSDLALGVRAESDRENDSPVYDYDPCVVQPSSFLAFDC